MGDLSRSHNNKHHLWSKMGLKLGTIAVLLILSILYISLATSTAVENDSKHLSLANVANPLSANEDGHLLTRREAGRGGKKSCEGKRCSKKQTSKGAKKDKKVNQKPKSTEKKRKSLRRKQLQRRNRKKDNTKAKAKSGKKSKSRKGGQKKKKSQKKSSNNKEKKKNGSRRKGEGSSRRKGGGSSRRKVGSSSGRQITGNATSCAMKLVLYARLNEKKASSISKQIARIFGNDKIQESKGQKNGEFNATMARLLSALGGDASNPKCDGSPISGSNASGRAVHRNGSVAKETLETLQNCSIDIAAKCGSPLTGNATKKAQLEACVALADKFKSDFASCTGASKSIDAACICIEAINATEVEEMQKCDTSSDNTDALARKKACKKAVGTCKTAEANAVEGIDSCKERTKCGGAKDKEEAQRQLAALTPLNDALNRKEMDNAMASAGVSSGPGADGTVPSSRTLTGGSRNSTDGAGCVDLAQQWAQFNTSANQAAGSANGDLDTGAANATTTILNAINSRTTLVADLQSCANGSRIQSSGGRQIEIVITIIQIRIYIFWCGWWRDTIITVKITIITSTFSIETSATTSAATTASSAPTSSAGSANGSIAPTTSGAPSSGSSGATAITIPFNTSSAASSATQATTVSGNDSFSSNSFDIALLKISESVDLDAWSPACLPTSGADFTGQNGWVYGWGKTSENGANLADKLLELEVPIVSDSVCVSAMSGTSITSDMLCAGGENGKDACGGDSGGPFTVANSTSGAHTLVGAVSFGVGCAREGLYGVYADIPFFRTWIDETIAAKGGATFCS